MSVSSYTRYLPAILSSPENDPNQFLGRMLRIFEHLLTGIDPDEAADATIVQAVDDRIELASPAEAGQFQAGDILTIDGVARRLCVKQVSGPVIRLTAMLDDTRPGTTLAGETLRLSRDGALNDTIAGLPALFDPWRTPAHFLPWLASWLALPLEPEWSEYQRRKFVSEILNIYQQRGLKQGLLTYLDIYATTEERPRIAIDGGEAVFRGRWATDGSADLKAVAYSHVAADVPVLLHPSAIAVDRDNNYIVADQGGDVEPAPAALWKLAGTGEIPYRRGSSVPIPAPIYAGDAIENPTAVAVDRQNDCYVLSIGTIGSRSRAALHRFASETAAMTTVIDQTTSPVFSALHPVDMVLEELPDGAKTFTVLDRGSHRGSSSTKLVVVRTGAAFEVEDVALTDITEPTAIVQDAEGRLIIADAREPARGNSRARAADLIRIDPDDDWSETSLLGDLDIEQNPLIFPTGLVFESRQSLLVCDTGVRERSFQDGSNRNMAEPAAIYRVDLSQSPVTITRITNQRHLVHPTKIVIDRRGDLIVADRGAAYDIQGQEREWRARTNEFGVVVYFSQQRPTSVERRNQIRFAIANVIDEQKPGHTAWWMKSL